MKNFFKNLFKKTQHIELEGLVAIQSCEDPETEYIDFPDGLRLIFRNDTYAGWYLPENKTDWISVKDALPTVGSRVLACGENGGIFLCKAEGENTGFGRMDGCSKHRTFTHWKPLPTPPAEVFSEQ